MFFCVLIMAINWRRFALSVAATAEKKISFLGKESRIEKTDPLFICLLSNGENHGAYVQWKTSQLSHYAISHLANSTDKLYATIKCNAILRYARPHHNGVIDSTFPHSVILLHNFPAKICATPIQRALLETTKRILWNYVAVRLQLDSCNSSTK